MTLFARRLLILLSLVSALRVVCAQVPDATATGSVTGTITYGDTQRPARFAKVMLTPVKSKAPDVGSFNEKDVKDDPAAAMKVLGALMGSVTMLQAQTGLDGTYTLSDVAPGDYYLSPSSPGYVSPLVQANAAAPEDAGLAKTLAGVPVVHVEANHTTRGDAALERGAALNGTVLFDDGSPVTGAIVQFENVKSAAAKAAKKAAKKNDDDDDMADFGSAMSLAMSGGLVIASTDDRGRFRLAGLPAGEYTVQATVTVSSAFSMRAGVMDMNRAKGASPLKFYAPGTLYVKEAAKITVKSGEDRGDIEIKVDLAGMKSVSGRVLSAGDHHGLNSGTVTLTDTTDKKVKRTGSVDAMGAFTVGFVPPGTYTLEVSDGADKEAAKQKPGAPALVRFAAMKTVRSYEDASQPLIVAASDVTGVSVELKESKTVKKDMDLNQLFGGGAAKE